MKIPASIFRSYDIRGIYPDALNEENIEHIGKAFGTFLVRKGLKKVVVGRDNRESSPTLSESFISGLLSTGCNVTDIGISLTPIIHFLTCVKHFDAGVCVTASHNPKEYNGLRMDYAKAVSFYGDDITKLRDIALREDYVTGKGSLQEENLSDLYIDYIAKRFSFNGVRVAIDCGNGTSSYFAEKIFSRIGCDVKTLYCEPNSTFPLGVPDPERKSFMNILEESVKENDVDIGIAFDNDVDRFGVVDETGVSYETDKLLLLLAESVLEHTKGATIVYDVKCTGLLEKYIKDAGGVAKILRTGHPYITQAVQAGALLGGEFSGHVVFGGQYFGYDDGIYSACKVIEVMQNKEKPLSELMSKYPKLAHTSEIKVPSPDDKKFKIIEDVVAALMTTKEVRSVISVDGVRVRINETGWFLIRASNTTPVLSVRVEGKDENEVNQLLEMVRIILSPYDDLDVTVLDQAQIYFS